MSRAGEPKDLDRNATRPERSVGQIAHDLNNVLTEIINYATLISRSAGGSSTVGRDADRIISAGHRGAALIRELFEAPGGFSART